jgi:hypothetical protein
VDIAGRNRRNGGAAITTGISVPATSHDDVGYFAGGFHINALRTPVGTTTSGSAIVTGMASTTGLVVGMFVEGTGIPTGATINAVAANQITLSANATASGTITLKIYQNAVSGTRNLANNTAYPNFENAAFPLGQGTTPGGSARICQVAEDVLTQAMVSMERVSSFGDGTNPSSWEHATLTGPRTTSIGTYIKSDYKDRTIATPGEINSRWSTLP